ncbi:hypothetical protein LX32DRAFT_339913 [Colletotrichum zoysiae]|uniref:Uncharacterized protein n=1 Tax=Colletotrichum zoysiae TaxID=1216348 RepID=A0AAD9HT51_9PEZI|nr:hypothetical protein LX32DRAFT_339913 [Colletotrichum zoysiae]
MVPSDGFKSLIGSINPSKSVMKHRLAIIAASGTSHAVRRLSMTRSTIGSPMPLVPKCTFLSGACAVFPVIRSAVPRSWAPRRQRGVFVSTTISASIGTAALPGLIWMLPPTLCFFACRKECLSPLSQQGAGLRCR